MKTILRSTAAIALVGAATAAGTYPTDAEACTIFEGGLQCEMIVTKDACSTDTRCEWFADNEECGASDAFELPMMYSLMNATAALTDQIEICSEFGANDCAGSCAYGYLTMGGDDYDYGVTKSRKLLQEDEMPLTCAVSPAKAQSLLIADGADPYIKGFLGFMFAAGFKCPFATTEAACTPLSGCAWGQTDYSDGNTCYASQAAAMLMVNNKCQGTISDTLEDYYSFQSDGDTKTIAEIYEWAGVVDESSPAALAAAPARVERRRTLLPPCTF